MMNLDHGSVRLAPGPADFSATLELVRRGLQSELPQGELPKRLQGGPLRVKLGLDPTASQVHLGWAVVLRKLRHFQEAGHIAVLVVGDFTARIGDPTGKSATRKRLSAQQVKEYSEACLTRVTPLLLRDRLEIHYNSEWLEGVQLEDVLRLLSTATVSQILARDDFQKRFSANRPISMVEFVYPLLQAYDAVQLRADVELGGNDQLFNNLMGRAVQQAYGQRPQMVCTLPLLVGLDGVEKMSQSLGNFVAVDDAPNDMFGKLMSIPDTALVDFCRLAAWMPSRKVAEIAASLGNKEVNPATIKRLMARAVVDLYHGDGAGGTAEDSFNLIHVHRGVSRDAPEVSLDSVLNGGLAISVSTLVSELFGLSRSAARRLIDQAGVRVDGAVVREDQELDRLSLTGAVIQKGKREAIRLV
jgi:tyrosyl-tRNA synthetase